ncbi:VOC family protein [Microbaculum marinum]|uniref:VOC family protein n=1 Tax=Microbaculum marinum TaxID=1764581 RepID=A0AAW9RV67_9HYPH
MTVDHVSIAVADLEAATRFYRAVLATIGLSQLVARPHTAGFGKSYPEFWLNARPGMSPVPPDGGAHICLRCRSRQAVVAFHEAALARGGSDAGAPGDRQGARTPYFGAFIRDPDGNKIEVVTFPRSDEEEA